MTKGYATSEFWITLVVVVLGAVTGSGLFPETHWVVRGAGMILAALASIGYTAARAKVKAAAQTGNGQQGFAAAGLLAIVALAGALATAGILSACSAAQRTETKTALIDCAKDAAQGGADDLGPAVADALAQTDWEARLDRMLTLLTEVGRDAFACAIQYAEQKVPTNARALASGPDTRSRASEYIRAQGWRYTSGL